MHEMKFNYCNEYFSEWSRQRLNVKLTISLHRAKKYAVFYEVGWTTVSSEKTMSYSVTGWKVTPFKS